MEQYLYETFYKNEKEHWWFVARSEIINNIIDKFLHLNKKSFVLDVGCGTGSILETFSKKFTAYGIDFSQLAVDFCKQRGLENVSVSTLEDLNHNNQKYDLITFLDIIEHIDDDRGTLKSAKNLLNKDGHILVTVPAYQFLFGPHDEANFHKRRYLKRDLKSKIEEAGFEIVKASYFNTFLSPLAFLGRFYSVISKKSVGLEIPNKFVNSILTNIFRMEKFLLNYVRLPFGISIICLAKVK